jgi:CO/xanthine dehydrogenase FAD-binding subunit
MSHLLANDHLAVATDLDEALEWRQNHPAARVIAGGTEVLADQALELFRPNGYLHLGRVEALQSIAIEAQTIRIGAGVTIERLGQGALADALPILAQLAQTIGTPQARRRGTVGGNLGNGLPDRSLAPALLALGCSVILQSRARGERNLPLADFLQGRGRTALADDELITSITVQRRQGFQRYTQVGPRAALVYPTVATALVMDPSSRRLALGIANAADTAIRAKQAEAAASAAIDWEQGRLPVGVAEDFGQRAAAACSPCDDLHASAAYRRHAVAVMARRLLEDAFSSASTKPTSAP